MADEGLLIRIGADVDGAVTNISKVPAALVEVGTSAKKTAASVVSSMGEMSSSVSQSSKAYNELNAALDKIEAAFNDKWNPVVEKAQKSVVSLQKQVQSFGNGVSSFKVPDYFKKTADQVDKIKAPSDKAAFALMNLGRIAQDAPFGFIGIQNNINPMLESFQRLKAETGSTSSALKAMVGGLSGGAGLGLAVSVITSLITVFAMHMGAAKEEVSEAKKKNDEFKKSVDEIFAGQAKEVTQVQSLIAVLESETATRERKLGAIKALQKINPEVFDGLRMEGSLVVGLDDAYKSYIENIKAVTAVKVKQKQLEDVTQKILEKEGTTLDANEKVLHDIVKTIEDKNIAQNKDNANNPVLAKRIKDTNELNLLYKQQKDLVKGISELQAGVKVDDKVPNGVIEKLQQRIKDVNEQIQKEPEISKISGLVSVRKDLEKQLEDLVDKKADKVIKDAKYYKDELERAFTAIDIKESATGKDLDPERISAIETAIRQLLDIKVSATSKTIRDLKDQINALYRSPFKSVDVFTEREQSKPLDPFPDTFDKKFQDPTGGALHILDQIVKKQKEATEGVKKYQAGVADLGKSLVGTFENVFTELISGGGNALKIFGQYIQTIIMKLIAAAAISAILSAVTGGFGAGAKGGGFSALFGKISGFGNLFPAHAAGGITTGPHLALVGDNASGKEAIIPFERMGEFLNNFGGGRNIEISGRLVAEGDHLVTVISRTNAKQKRAYG